jgi:hypothetical protein
MLLRQTKERETVKEWEPQLFWENFLAFLLEGMGLNGFDEASLPSDQVGCAMCKMSLAHPFDV